MTGKFIFLIKVKGKNKIPDYVQIRDEAFTLLAYCRADRPEKSLIKIGLEPQLQNILDFLENLPFGKMVKYKL